MASDTSGPSEGHSAKLAWTARGKVVLPAALTAVLTLLAACDTSSAKVAPTAARTATPTNVPRVLYQADWSHGTDGWTLAPHWKIQNGALVNDGGGDTSLTVPYTVTSANYEVDMDVQTFAVTQPYSCGNHYGLEAQDASGTQLYIAQIWCLGNHTNIAGESQLSVPSTDGYATSDWAVHHNLLRTYRVVVLDKRVVFYPGAPAVGGAASSVPLSPAAFDVQDGYVQLAITRFVVLAE